MYNFFYFTGRKSCGNKKYKIFRLHIMTRFTLKRPANKPFFSEILALAFSRSICLGSWPWKTLYIGQISLSDVQDFGKKIWNIYLRLSLYLFVLAKNYWVECCYSSIGCLFIIESEAANCTMSVFAINIPCFFIQLHFWVHPSCVLITPL